MCLSPRIPLTCSQVVLGTVFLWVGWIGFNGGSCFAASLKAAMAVFVTNLAGSVGVRTAFSIVLRSLLISQRGITWLIMDFRLERKWRVVGFCTGAIAGLVAITPAAGFVGAPVRSSRFCVPLAKPCSGRRSDRPAICCSLKLVYPTEGYHAMRVDDPLVRFTLPKIL